MSQWHSLSVKISFYMNEKIKNLYQYVVYGSDNFFPMIKLTNLKEL